MAATNQNVKSKMMQRIIYSLVIATTICMSLMNCEPAPEDLFVRHFLIRKGEHYSTPRLMELLQSERLVFKAKFNESAMYDLGDPGLQSNKNKLLGFSDCNALHHENSARFAWQWFNNRLEIYAYCYVNSLRVEEFIGTVNLNEENRYEIVRTENEYIFYLNGERITTIRKGDTSNKGVYYMLYPYFGGSAPAPQDVRIDLSILK